MKFSYPNSPLTFLASIWAHWPSLERSLARIQNWGRNQSKHTSPALSRTV